MTGTSPFVIVVAFDGSEHSQTALKWAVEEAKQRKAQLRLVTVWSNIPLAWYTSVMETALGGIVEVDSSPELIAQTLQAKVLESDAVQGLDITGKIIHDRSPATAILAAAKGADLIVLGSRGLGGFSGLNLGSVSNQIVHHAPCSVLVTRPRVS